MFPLRDHEPSGAFPIISILVILLCAYILVLETTIENADAFIMTWSIVPAYVDFYNLSSLKVFVTSIFLHGGLFHFASNMWFLWIFGDNVEASLGKIRYVIFFLLGGAIAGLTQYVFMPNAQIPILGASGAIAAVLGYYLVLFPRSTIDTIIVFPYITTAQVSAKFMLGLWFISQVFSGTTSIAEAASGGTAWWAHIAGFVFGYIVGSIHKSRIVTYGELI